VIVKFWGCRGSIPVPDSRMMRYGGNTTCVEIITNGKVLVVDAGTGIRKLGENLIKRKIFNFDLFITHSHWDHIQGFPFFAPIYSEKTKINILGSTNSYKQVKSILSSQMSYEFFPVSFYDLKSKINFVDISRPEYISKDYVLKFIETNHPIYTLGLRVENQGKSFVFITDNELRSKTPSTSWEEFVDFCSGADYLIHDAQFTDQEYKKRIGWGHSTFEQALSLAKDAQVKNLGLFHHDPNRKDSGLEKIEKRFQTLSKMMGYKFKVFAVREMDRIHLSRP
jgi:phosphoribosyl 1,2-cyclic phosphodiesterase